MMVEQDTALAQTSNVSATGSPSDNDSTDWRACPHVSEAVAQLDGDRPRFVARAPGHLDVMGGLADFAGALVLSMPTGDPHCAAVQLRSDSKLVIRTLGRDGAPDTPLIELRWSDLRRRGPAPANGGIGPGSSVAAVDVDGPFVAQEAAVGVLASAARAGLLPSTCKGLSVAIAFPSLDESAPAPPASIASAVLVAVAAALGIELALEAAAELCCAVQHEWLGRSPGIAQAMCVLGGEAHRIAQVRCDPCDHGPAVSIPDHLCLVGIDCGVVHKDAALRYDRARVASHMGRVLIDRIIQHEGAGRMRWDGYLSRVSVTDYIERFRDRLPTKISGREFLDRFGETGDPCTRIEPGFIYKVRSRTEHHIYEHARSQQFVERLVRAGRAGGSDVLHELSELMYASHWSYGQRCGLGSIETDLLVRLLRHHGAAEGVHGAKVVGRGCGGAVLVLTEATDAAFGAVEGALAAYADRTKKSPRVLRGSIPGAWVAGARKM